MSYIIEYKRQFQQDILGNEDVIHKEIVSSKQHKAIKKIPWITIISIKKSNKHCQCNCLS